MTAFIKVGDIMEQYIIALILGIIEGHLIAFWNSRSGATIAGGMLIGCTRRAAADFSFVMAVPVMIIVCVYDLLRVIHLLELNDIIMFAIGTLVSYIVGYITVKVFLWYLNRSSLSSFGYYRIIVAILAIIYLYLWLPMRKKWSLKSLEKILA